jgi:hypothetical protein
MKEDNSMMVMKEMNEHMANREVVGRKFVHIVVVVHKDFVVADDRIDLAAAVDKVAVVAMAVHKAVGWEVGHIAIVAVLGRTTEDMERTSGLAVVGQVGCILFALEGMVKMRRMVVDEKAEETATEVVLGIRVAEASAVRVVGQDMEWQPGLLDRADRRCSLR